MKKKGKLGLIIFYSIVGLFSVYLVFHYRHFLLRVFHHLGDPHFFEREFHIRNAKTALIIMGIEALTTAIPGLSSSVACVFMGGIFGPFLACVLNVIGNTIGNFWIATLMEWMLKRSGSQEKKDNPVNRLMKEVDNPRLALILAYMIPMIPTIVLNGFAIAQGMSPKERTICTAIGITPLSCIYALAGASLTHGIGLPMILIVLNVGMIVVCSWLFYFRKKKNK